MTEEIKNNKKIILNCEKLETRFALLRNKRLEEYKIERPNEEAIVGSVYLGRIVNLEPTLQAAFVDIGAEKNAFLHYWDMLPASYDMADKVNKNEEISNSTVKKSTFSSKLRNLLLGEKNKKVQEFTKKMRREKIKISDIPKLFPTGSEVLVQVTKGPIGTKGARVTTNITLPGRYLVLLPYSDHRGLSSKIENKTERDRLRKILSELDVPEGMGVICRTIGEGRKYIFFKRDLDMMLAAWHKVNTFLENPKVPALVYREPNLLERTVRDFLTEDIDEIFIDNPEAFKTMKGLLTKFGGRKMAEKVKNYTNPRPIFEFYGIKHQIADIFKRVVPLPSGGYLCVDETEALVAIDVNTGKNRKSKDQPETILNTNLEAAEEVARQLRLRNVGGLVVIDFIDMRPQKDREKVFKLMKKLVKEDRAKSKMLPISKLGLMEMTRKREQESLQDAVYDPCPYCNGTGLVKSTMSMSVEIQRSLQQVLKAHSKEKDIEVRVIIHPAVLARLKNEDASILIEMEKNYGRNLSFRADKNIHHEEFKLVDPETGAEY